MKKWMWIGWHCCLKIILPTRTKANLLENIMKNFVKIVSRWITASYLQIWDASWVRSNTENDNDEKNIYFERG